MPLLPLLFAVAQVPLVLDSGLAIESVGRGGRIPFPTDALVQQVVDGTWRAPAEGDTIANRTWAAVKANDQGWFEGRAFQGGYAAFTVRQDRAQVMVMNAAGHNLAYINGELRGGDVYAFGYNRVPVQLKAGDNHLLFATGRGRLRVALEPMTQTVMFNRDDLTLPDLIDGKPEVQWGAVIVMNGGETTLEGASLKASLPNDGAETTKIPSIPPMSIRKVGFRIPKGSDLTGDTAKLTLELKAGTVTESFTPNIRIRKPEQTRRETFVSEIDGSVQYYAVVPPPVHKPGLAMVLTVHGASVEAQGQAEAYSAKDWCYTVAATNRRPFGFDWEDWGRMDAMEVLDHVQAKYGTDPRKTYLTGHSMGGHGTWQLGALFPDRFAAIAPSAGWRSFYTYVGKPRMQNPTPMETLFERAVSPTDTELMIENYRTQAVYILHGDADDNVPVREARAMRDTFAKMGKEIGYHEEKGAGHWWDGDRSPGADCVDWPPIFDMFRKTELKGFVKTDRGHELKFMTLNPAISNRVEKFEIRRQNRKLEPSTIHVVDDGKRLTMTTQNVAALRLLANVAEIDGQPVPPKRDRSMIWNLELRDGKWQNASANPIQTGPFKEAMRRRMAFVYATKGTAEENAWSFAKARYDAEQWWYRGNGAVDVMADTAVPTHALSNRNLVVYGHADMNAALGKLKVSSLLALKRNAVSMEGKRLEGDFGCLYAVEAEGGMVAVIGGTSLKGLRATDRLPLFAAGVAYPDWTILDAKSWTDGTAAVAGAGFWGEPGVWTR